MTDTPETIRAILESLWPDECEIVDHATMQHIVTVAWENQNFDDAFRSVHGGADWDAMEIIKFLVEAAVFIKTSLEIWKLLTSQLGRRPSKKEFIDVIATKSPEALREQLEGIATKIVEMKHSPIQQ